MWNASRGIFISYIYLFSDPVPDVNITRADVLSGYIRCCI
ncbi:hypothetical protein HMPREF1548_06639 [Clostridium sp. KLE 1755]|nr:hypothetical protein HMPREF1548_06639 [Clostridium sp. KLE 1755]